MLKHFISGGALKGSGSIGGAARLHGGGLVSAQSKVTDGRALTIHEEAKRMESRAEHLLGITNKFTSGVVNVRSAVKPPGFSPRG